MILRILLMAALGLCASLAAAAEAPPRLRLLTYNIRHALGGDDVVDLLRIAKVIKQARPDLVALQEVDVGVKRTNQVDQARELGRLTDMKSAFGKALNTGGGAFGNAILSRWPVQNVTVHPLPRGAKTEARTLLSVRVRPRNGLPKLLFATTLLGPESEQERILQMQEINRKLVPTRHVSSILAGDFAADPSDPPIGILLEKWEATGGAEPDPTAPAKNPDRTVDYVMVSQPSGWKVVDVDVIDEPLASDHRPLLVVLEWVGEPDD
jgi:endonuclease/exonuclease/phosphatase family metal-dependent hydrolase